MGLAKAQLPAGIVAAATHETPRPFVTQSVAGRVTLRNVLDAFEETHPGYGAGVSSGVVKIRPNYGTSCDRSLRAAVPAVTLSGVDETVVEELFSLARPGAAKGGRSGGRVGSTPTRPDERAPLRQARELSLHLDPTSFEAALDALVLKTGASVWVAEERLPKQGLSQCQFTAGPGRRNELRLLL
jgi:hypothetical protein